MDEDHCWKGTAKPFSHPLNQDQVLKIAISTSFEIENCWLLKIMSFLPGKRQILSSMILPCHMQKLTISLKCGVWKTHVPQRLNIPPECYHFFNKRIVAIWNKEAGWSQMAKPVPTPNLYSASKFTFVWFPVGGFQLMFWFCCLLCIYFLCYANETVISITCLGCNSFYEKTQRVLLFHSTQINSKTLAVKSGLCYNFTHPSLDIWNGRARIYHHIWCKPYSLDTLTANQSMNRCFLLL